MTPETTATREPESAPPGDPPPPAAPGWGSGGGGSDGGDPQLGTGTNRRALLQLLAAVAGIVAVAILAHGEYVLIVVVALVLVVMLHELGHFATAKWGGMKVTEYFLGFGPRLWSIRRGETEYGVKGIPAGGYVRIIGMTTAEEIDPDDEPRTYRRASFPRRLAVGVAGSTMHFVMAFLLLLGLYAFVGIPTVNGAGVGGLYDFSSGRTPAQIAGLKAGDVFVSVDGRAVTDPTTLESYIEAHTGRTITVVVRRDGHDLTLRVTPVDGRAVKMKGTSTSIKPLGGPAQGVIGIELESLGPNLTSGWASPLRAGSMLGSLTKTTVIGVGQVFSPHGLSTIAHDLASSTSSQTPAQQASDADRPVSIVGVVQIASQAAQQDVAELLVFLAYVNIFFGLFNMFPMLPLDGGHVAIAIYERIRSRRGRRYFADAQKMMPFAYALLLFIAIFGLSALYLDIVNPIHLGG